MTINPDGSLDERETELFFNEELDIFFVTGQSLPRDKRRAYIEVKSTHVLTQAQITILKKNAKPFSESGTTARVNQVTQELVMYDDVTNTSTLVPLANLSEEVQKKYPLVKAPSYFDKLLP